MGKGKQQDPTPPTGVRKKFDEPSVEQVRDYLRNHAEFLNENSDLLPHLTPPEYDFGNGVVDFQRYTLERLRGDMQDLGSYHGKLIAATRSNLSSQQQIHRAVLMLLDADSLGTLVHTVTADWVDTLGVDAIALCFEAKKPRPELTRSGLRRLQPGIIGEVLNGTEDAVLLHGEVTAERTFFGPAAPLIEAEALVRLTLPGNTGPGLLAFGSRDEKSFYPGQGTELVRFLAQILERCLTRWLSEKD